MSYHDNPPRDGNFYFACKSPVGPSELTAKIIDGLLWGSYAVLLPGGTRVECHNLGTARRLRDQHNVDPEAVAKSPLYDVYAAALRSGERAKLFSNRRR
jgi:hypothetical protein